MLRLTKFPSVLAGASAKAEASVPLVTTEYWNYFCFWSCFCSCRIEAQNHISSPASFDHCFCMFHPLSLLIIQHESKQNQDLPPPIWAPSSYLGSLLSLLAVLLSHFSYQMSLLLLIANR